MTYRGQWWALAIVVLSLVFALGARAYVGPAYPPPEPLIIIVPPLEVNPAPHEDESGGGRWLVPL